MKIITLKKKSNMTLLSSGETENVGGGTQGGASLLEIRLTKRPSSGYGEVGGRKMGLGKLVHLFDYKTK